MTDKYYIVCDSCRIYEFVEESTDSYDSRYQLNMMGALVSTRCPKCHSFAGIVEFDEFKMDELDYDFHGYVEMKYGD